MKIVTILGARPQFIKAASVSREIKNQVSNGVNINEFIVHTGQHYDVNMSDIFFQEMKIPKPHYSLGVRGMSQGHMTGQMIENIEKVLLKESPDWVLVYGDTNSTLAGAIAASKLNIKIAHIEAGLRSFNIHMPEEINRIMTDRVSSLLFCPTKDAIKNLTSEGFNHWKNNAEIVLSGDVMQDSAIYYKEFSKKPIDISIEDNFVLGTIHRAENTNDSDRLRNIVNALNEIAKKKQVILPLHPRTKIALKGASFDTSNLTIINPVGYLNMIWLIDHCSQVMTDSGGLQKEAFFFKKPCITFRDETEWVELVTYGFNVIAPPKNGKILDAYKSFKQSLNYDIDLYGQGKACSLIVKKLISSTN